MPPPLRSSRFSFRRLHRSASYNRTGGRLWPGSFRQPSCSSFGNPRQNRKSLCGPMQPESTRMRGKMDKDCRIERDSRARPQEQLCPLRNRHGTGEPGRNRCGTLPNLIRSWPTILITLQATSCPRKHWRVRAESNEAIERLKAGIACAARSGNSHAQNEMQAMLDELEAQE